MTTKELYIGLNSGKRYITKNRFLLAARLYVDGDWRYFIPGAQLYITAGNYIGWNNAGSSANKNTLKDLQWILDNIFHKTAADFVQLPE